MVNLIIYCNPRTKKNNMQILKNRRTGKSFIAPSNTYKEFENICLMQITGDKRLNINDPVNIKAIFYMETKRKVDLTNLLEAIDDTLVQANVIADDNRNIIAGHDGSRVMYCRDNPRIEIEITKVKGYEQW